MANTDFVACRSPSHSIARLFIEKSQVPIAAPRSNKFEQVSPIKAMHIFDDLRMEDVLVRVRVKEAEEDYDVDIN